MKPISILSLLILMQLLACTHKANDKTILNNSNDSLMVNDTINKPSSHYQNFKFKHPDFEAFYIQFIKDSLFQLSRTKFPIKGCYSDHEGDQKWNKTHWPMINWDLRKELKSSQDSISIQQTNTDFFYGVYCLDCGFSYEMAFQKEKETWFLVYRQENNF